MPQHSRNEESIFLAALEKPTPQERLAFVEGACGDDPALLDRLRELLRSHDGSIGPLDVPPAPAFANTVTPAPITEKPGTVVGPYKLLQQIGEGGFGVVYMAEQTEPVRRKVALKIIKPGMDTKEVIARFEAERQALALMDHPNIAKVLDAGATESGRPYFVMELVKGVPLTEYCDKNHLSARDRLGLFVSVCHAIQHAHQKGVIHRDLKPSNIMVTLHDGKPVPKVIDFGVSKALSQQLTEKTLFTAYGQMVGTPAYMSPEQAEMSGLDIDTRSDVYSLGVLLYELLTGCTPFDAKRLRTAGYAEMQRIIREEEPVRPSTRLTTLGEDSTVVSKNRGTDPKKLGQLVRGDLDWIVMKALDKERNRRYETANGIAADIERFLADEPVEACPPSAAYRFRKFARRNKGPMAITAAAVVALVVVAIGSTIAAGRFRGLARKNAELLEAKDAAFEREQDLREEAQEQSRIATEQSRIAENALTEKEQERQRADENREIAEEREVLARRNLYTAHMNLAQDAWKNTDIPRVVDLLQRHVPAPGEPDWRSFEWYHLLGLCNQDEMTIRCYHSAHRPAFSPDGKVLAVGLNGGRIELWDLDNRERIQVVEDATVFGPLAFSPDGRTLASAGGGEVKLWDVATGERIRSMGGHQHHMLDIAFTPDGSRIISTDGGDIDSRNIPGIIRVWDVVTGDLLHELKGHSSYIYSIDVSPDGARLTSAGRNEVRFWDLEKGESLENPGIRGQDVVIWSPEGTLIATDRNGISIWDSHTGHELTRISIASPTHSLSFSPDGTLLASAHHDSTVRLWEVSAGEELAVYKGHSHWVFHVTFSPDGKRLASVGRDLNVKVWPVERKNSTESLAGSTERSARVPGRSRMRLSPDGHSLAALQDAATVAIVDVPTGDVRKRLPVGSEICALAFSSDGQRLVVGHQVGIQLWDLETGPLREWPSESPVWTVDISPDGTLLAAGTDAQRVEIYQTESAEKLTTLPWEYNTALRSVAFSPDGKYLAVTGLSEPRELHIWRVGEWPLQLSMEYSNEYADRLATDLAFSPEGGLLAVSEGSPFMPRNGALTRLFDPAQGTQLAVLSGDDSYHTAVTVSGDGNTLATGTEQGKITLWDLGTLEERTTLQWDGHSIESLALAPDGRTLVSSDSRARVRIWRSAPQERIDRIEIAGLYSRAVEYAAEGRWQEADELFSHLLERRDNLDVRTRRARTYAALGRWEDAIADFRQVAEADRRNYRPWYELALACLVNGDQAGYRDACAEMLDRFGETHSPITAEFVCWTNALSPQSDLDWGKLVALASVPFAEGEAGAGARKSLGAILLRAGLYEDALAQFESAASAVQQERNRTTMDYNWYLTAMAHTHLGDLDAAHSYLNRTEPISEVDDDDSVRLLRTDNSPGWFRPATLRLLRHESETLLRAADSEQQGASFSPTEQPKRALEIYSRAIELQGDIPLLWRLRAQVHQRLNQSAEEAADLARAAEIDQELPLRRLNRLVGGNRGGDNTDRFHFRLDRAQYLYEVLGDYDAAIRDCHVLFQSWRHGAGYERAIDLFFKAHEARGTLESADADWYREFGQMGDFYNARARYYRRTDRADKADLDLARYGWGRDHSARQQKWRSQRRADAGADPWQHLMLARDHRILGDNEQAETELEAAAAAAPDDPNVWLARAALFELWYDIERAEADWQRAVELAGDDPMPWIQRGRWYAERGEQEKAEADFAQAASLTPNELNRFLEAGWWVIGPYPENLAEFCPPELDPDPSRPLRTIDPESGVSDEPVAWRTIRPDPAGVIDLDAALPSGEHSAYLLNYVYAPKERTATLRTNDQMEVRIWVNAALCPTIGPVLPDTGLGRKLFFTPLTLRPGRNTVLIKLNRPPGDRFSLRLNDHPVERAFDLARAGLPGEAGEIFASEYSDTDATDATDAADWSWLLRKYYFGSRGHADKVRLLANDRNDMFLAARLPDCPLDGERLGQFADERNTGPSLSAWGRRGLALCYIRAGRYEDALAISENTGMVEEAIRAIAQHHLGRHEQARELLRQSVATLERRLDAARSDPVYFPFMDSQLYMLTREAHALIAGDTERIDQLYDQFQQARRELWEARDPAAEAFDDLVMIAADDPQPFLARGRRLAELGRLEEAEADFNKAVELAPEDIETRLARAEFFARCGNSGRAWEEFDVAIKQARGDRLMHRRLEIHDLTLDEGLRRSPDSLYLRRIRAYRQLTQGNWTDAVESLLPGRQWRNEVSLAPLCCLLEDTAGWRQARQRLDDLVANGAGPPSGPTWQLLLLGLNPISAETDELARSLQADLASEPQSRFRDQVVGLAQYRNGQYEEAAVTLIESLRPQSGWQTDAMTWPLLAMTEWRLGHQEEARRWLEQTAWWIDLTRRAADIPHAVGPDYAIYYPQWLCTHLFYREANALIDGDDPPESPQENELVATPEVESQVSEPDESDSGSP